MQRYTRITRKYGCISYPVSGYYLIREADTLTFIHCGGYKDRPAQADNMHMDVWYKGENVLLDAGSYKYNTTPELTKYFVGTASHNTVMLDENDQMLKGGRFIWHFWPKNAEANLVESNDEYEFDGRVTAFGQLGKNIVHHRRVIKKKGQPEWIVEDEIEHKLGRMRLRQIWHQNKGFKVQDSRFKVGFESDGEQREGEGWTSDYYGEKRSTVQTEFLTNSNKITTTIKLK